MDHSKFLEFVDENNPAEIALLREYCALADQIGLPAERVDSALRWARGNAAKFGGNLDRAKASFVEHMRQDGVDADHVEKILDWHGIVVEHGLLEKLPDQADASNDVARADELRELRKIDPEKFWADKGLQDELLEINDRLLSRPAIETKPAPAPARPAASPADRLAEIRKLRQNNPDAYDNDRALQAEELNLVKYKLLAGNEPGGAPVSPAQRAASPAERLAEIRQLRRNDPDAYDKDRTLQAEELTLIESKLPAGNEPGSAPASPAPAPPAAAQGASDAQH